MRRGRDPVLWVGAALVLATVLHGAVSSASWIGKPFAGFLLLENGVVPSSGLAHWSAVEGGAIYQHELLAIDGEPVTRPEALQAYAASLPVGTPVTYRLRSGEAVIEREFATQLFTGVDYVLLFGSFLFCGLGLTSVGLAIRFLRPSDPAARGSALSLWLIGMWALTATDLYGPYQLFRMHAFFECLIGAGTFHLALVFPSPRSLQQRFPRLVYAVYAAAAALAIWNQVGLRDPDAYVLSHRVAVAAFGAAAFALIGALVWTYLRPPSFDARQRVKVLALGSVASLAPQVVLSTLSSASGGQAPENLMGWSGIFFPISVAYAVLRSDLLQVDAILRRTLSYAVLTGIVAVCYAGAIVAVEPVVRSSGTGSPWNSALVVAAFLTLCLLPLRDRVQLAVDRLFFRTSYDFRRIVADTSAQLASVTELDVVKRRIATVVADALAPESVELVVERPADAATPPRDASRSGVVEIENGGLAVTFVAEGRLVATLRLGRPLSGRFYSGDDRRFLLTLANQGAVALQNSLALLRLEELNLTLEERVEERTSELRKALFSLQETQKQMVQQEKMASIGQLVAGVAHEINNPLNFIVGNLFHLREYTDTLRRTIERHEDSLRTGPSEDGEQLVESVRAELGVTAMLEDLEALFEGVDEGVRRTTTIVRDLRTFSRSDSGAPTSVDLRESLDATLNLLRGRLKDIEIERVYADVPEVECLEAQVGQVFMNLISNAADAMGESGTLSVRLRSAGPEAVQVEVEDTGCGISEEQASRVFEPFFTTKEVGEGTGLGLAISYGVVARHGGSIEIESEPGRGTLFRVQLPLKFSDAGRDSNGEPQGAFGDGR